ncbi:MAG: hypothetical protein Kapaf2KO_17820 [Candidatus Kapaibacteriales bacterium]
MRFKYKISSIFVISIIFFSCSNQYKIADPISRDILNGNDLIFWDYYQSLEICEKIKVHDSIQRVLYLYQYGSDTISIDPNSILLCGKHNCLYGYVYNDILEELDTVCCGLNQIYIGGYLLRLWPSDEYPPNIEHLDSLTKATASWLEAAGC